MLRRIVRPKREEVAEDWLRLRNEELHNLYTSPNIIRVVKSRRVRWAGYVTRMGETKSACSILFVKPEGKRSLGTHRRRWEGSIRMHLKEIGLECLDFIRHSQNRDQWRGLLNTIMNLQVP
jgi:hypothetical protein